jgi:hypothetical protein
MPNRGFYGFSGKESPSASGGIVSLYQSYKIHTFLISGTFTADSAMTVDILLVGGGGSGGGHYGGGGGGGGVRYIANYQIDKGSYTVVVGSGGLAISPSSPSNKGNNGIASSVFGLQAAGGGGGGIRHDALRPPGTEDGANGGSGGGAGGEDGTTCSGGLGNVPPLSPVQGYDGGTGVGAGANSSGGGGGGGGGVGANGSGANGGNGGTGVVSVIDGVSTYYAGGGGAMGQSTSGTGGLGGGGAGKRYTNGVAGTNGLGGGGGGVEKTYYSGAGGSGIVIVRYLIG